MNESVKNKKQKVIYAYRRKGLDYFCTCDAERYIELSQKPNLFEVDIFYTESVDDHILQISDSLNQFGLTLIEIGGSYKVMKLGTIHANNKDLE